MPGEQKPRRRRRKARDEDRVAVSHALEAASWALNVATLLMPDLPDVVAARSLIKAAAEKLAAQPGGGASLTPVMEDRLATFETIVLSQGSHPTPEQGMCAVELAAYLAGEPFSDAPACVCPVLRAFMIAWNDALPDDATRTRLLKPFVPRLIDTKSTPAVEQRRADLALDWLVRVQTPAWLDLKPELRAQSEALRALAPLVTQAAIEAALPSLLAAQKASAAARDAAWAAAWDAAWDAAWAAARDAAWDAARDAAWAAARDAAWDAAWAAAWDKSYAAARDVLAPTAARLQASAIELLEQMLAVTTDTVQHDVSA